MENKISSPYSVTAKYLLYVLLLFTPLARGSVHYWHHSVIEVLALLMVLSLCLEKALTGQPMRRKTDLDLPIIVLLFLSATALWFSQARADSIEALTLLISYVAIFFVTLYTIRSRRDVLQLVYVICGIGLLLSLVGFCKYAGITLSFWVYDELRYPDAFISGVYGNHNHLAGYLEMVIPLMLALFLTRSRRGMTFIALAVLVILVTSCHILTLSRGGWFALGGALSLMTLVLLFHKRFRSKKILALLFTSFVVVIFFVLSGSDLFLRALSFTDDEVVLGIGGRMIIWKGTLAMIKENIFIGIGPGTFASVFPQYQPAGSTARFYQVHNDYLHFIVELGALFLPLLGWLLFSLFDAGRKKLRSSSRQVWGITLGAMIGIFAILIHSFVDFNLHIPANAILFTVLAAIVVAGPQQNPRYSSS